MHRRVTVLCSQEQAHNSKHQNGKVLITFFWGEAHTEVSRWPRTKQSFSQQRGREGCKAGGKKSGLILSCNAGVLWSFPTCCLSPLALYPHIEVKLRLSELLHVHIVFSPTSGYLKSVWPSVEAEVAGDQDTATALSWTGSREHQAMLCCYSSTCKETKLSMNCTTGAMLAAFEYFTSLFSKRPSWKRGAGRQEVEFSWGCTDLPRPQECAQDAARCPADCLPAFPLQV